MRQSGKRLSALLLALALLLGCAACGGRENTAATMHLVRTEGTVQVADDRGKLVLPLKNLGLFSGYALATLEESFGWISLDDAKLAKLDQDSGVQVHKAGRLLELNVVVGGLFFNVTKPLEEDEEMNIRTSSMVVGIRGTCGWVYVTDQEHMELSLMEGKVECSVLDGEGNVLTSETVSAGQRAELALEDGEASITVEQFDTAQLPAFVQEALDHPEKWGADTEAPPDGPTAGPSASAPGPEPTTGPSAPAGTPPASPSPVVDDIHVRVEGDTLYVSGAGTVQKEDCQDYLSDSTVVKLVVGDGITGIGERVFYDFRSLTSIDLPDGLVSIGDSAFFSCTKLTSVVLPNGLEELGEWAFANCSGLTSVTLPAGLKRIGDCAFRECSHLTGLSLPDSLVSIGDEIFCGCVSLTSLTLPNSLERIGANTFYHCAGLTSVVLPDSLVSIGDSAFSDCYSLSGITLPDSLKSIESQAFVRCYGLTRIILPDGLVSIGERAFDNCTGLTGLTLPVSVSAMGKQVFKECRDLTTLRAPEHLRATVEDWFGGSDTTVFEWY